MRSAKAVSTAARSRPKASKQKAPAKIQPHQHRRISRFPGSTAKGRLRRGVRGLISGATDRAVIAGEIGTRGAIALMFYNHKGKFMSRVRRCSALLLLVIGLAACSGMNRTQQRALSG